MDEPIFVTKECDPFAERADALIRLSEQIKSTKDKASKCRLLQAMDIIINSLAASSPGTAPRC